MLYEISGNQDSPAILMFPGSFGSVGACRDLTDVTSNTVTETCTNQPLAAIFGPNSALGSAIGTMFLSFGNAFMFGGLLATLPDQEVFDRFREMYRTGQITAAVAGKSI